MNRIIAIAAAALALSAPALDDTVTDSDGNVWARQGSLGRNDYVLTNAPGLPKTGGTMTGGLSLGTNELSFAGAVGPGDEYATNLWDRIRVFPSGLGSSIGLASMIWSYVPSAVSSGAWPAVSNRTAELIRSSSVSVDAYTRAETDERLAGKADEFTSWEFTRDISPYTMKFVEDEVVGWAVFYSSNLESMMKGSASSTEITWSDNEWSGGYEFTAKRRRVLRTGDPELSTPFEDWRTNTYSIAIGSNAVASVDRGIAIGFQNVAGTATEAAATAVAIGVGAKSTGGSSVAIGPSSQALAANSVQFGSGVNNEPATLKFRNWKIVGSDGRIPVERLPVGGADIQADMLDGVYYRRLIYDGSVYYVAVTNMPPLPQEQQIDDPEEIEP